LKPGERLTVTAELDTEELSPGDYDIIVRVDPQNRIEEADETNNERFAELTVL
jgi:subtilase family serine protease